MDIDTLIEKKERKSIKEIFEKKGENYFRKIEQNESLRLLKRGKIVLALGGGAFVNHSIRKEIKNSAISFWLDLNIKSIISRLKNVKKRPLLDENNLENSINRIYSERKKFYNESDYKIKSNNSDINNIVNKVIKLYENSES